MERPKREDWSTAVATPITKAMPMHIEYDEALEKWAATSGISSSDTDSRTRLL